MGPGGAGFGVILMCLISMIIAVMKFRYEINGNYKKSRLLRTIGNPLAFVCGMLYTVIWVYNLFTTGSFFLFNAP